MATHTYLSSATYINKLTFSYLETYSFQRGTEFAENAKLIGAEYNRLKTRKGKYNSLTGNEEKRLSELHKLLGFTQYIMDEEGKFHPSGRKINTYKVNDPQVESLKHILQTDIKEVPAWMCAPVYRDALVFYDQSGTIISSLNVCLTCQYMQTHMFNYIQADYLTYRLLTKFFIDIGHEIEEPK